MYATRHISASGRRPGVILIVVLALLTLFAIVGISFVYYANAEARASQYDRESQQALVNTDDVSPESVLNYFLGQFLHDTDNQNGVYSALRGHSLSRSIYGYNDTPGALNLWPFNGTGRLHGITLPGQDDYNLVNYTYFPADNFGVRDPERFGVRANPQVSPNPNLNFGINVPYTYPDVNNMYLAAVKADGTVLLPSFQRPWTGFGPFWTKDANGKPIPNPNWFIPSTMSPPASTALKYQVLRPRPIDQLMVSNGVVVETWPPNRPYFPPPADPGGDVKNLAGAPAWTDPVSGNQCNNDSFWMDVGFPVMTDLNGKKFKPLVAALIVDLDSRVNLNVHGNIKGGQNNTHVSNQGWGPWSVNLGTAMAAGGTEWTYLFAGNSNGPKISGRYGPDQRPGTAGPTNLATTGVAGHFYSPTDFNECDETNNYVPTAPLFWTPGITGMGAGLASCFPSFPPGYGNSSFPELMNHPSIYRVFPPPAGDDRFFPLSSLEALLRYGDAGSSNLLSSDLLRLCPNSFGDARTRRLVTARSFDIDRPGVVPWIWPSVPGTPPGTPPAPPPYQLTSPSLYPVVSAPIPFPAPSNPPNATVTQPPTEFGPDWRAISAALGRLDLNRPLPDYPQPVNGQITDLAGYQAAVFARQQLARDIFRVLLLTTADTPLPATVPAVGTPAAYSYDAQRWLAQLAVNIVDFIDTDEFNTPFQWNPNIPTEYVFGTELPRVVINEALAMFQPPPKPSPTGTTDVRVWVELYNPMNTDPTMPPYNGDVKLTGVAPGTGAYRIALCQPGTATDMRKADNVTGDPTRIPGNLLQQKSGLPSIVSDFPGTAVQNFIKASNGAQSDPTKQNVGFYVVGVGPFLPNTKTPPTLADNGMSYNVPTPGMGGITPPPISPTVVLQRLACPYRALDPNPTIPPGVPNPNYNPYITVDYMENVNASVPPRTPPVIQLTNRAQNPSPGASDGRNHPFVGGFFPGPLSQRQLQTSGAAPQPKNSFWSMNSQVPNPANFNWLVHLDRQLSSPMELLHVSAFKPHELTQQFVDPTNTKMRPFAHRAPWFDEDLASGGSHLLYRFFEFVMTRSRASGLAAPFASSPTRVTNSTPGSPTVATVTPLAMSGVSPSGVPWSIQPGSVLAIQAPDPNSGNLVIQETVVVTGVAPPNFPTNFTAAFYKSYNQANGPQGMNIILTSTGDRSPGRININTIWDPEILLALTDAGLTGQTSNNFLRQDVYDPTNPTNPCIFNQLMSLRTPSGLPGPTDQPFWGSATGLYPVNDAQFSNPLGGGPGYGINNTIFRSATPGGAGNTQRLFQVPYNDPNANGPPPTGTPPFVKYQLLNKIFNNTTTRSNVFAVWMTVGFFEVIQDTDPVTGQPVRPVKLGAEMNSATNQQIRHRMFAIVDRSGLAVPSPLTVLGTSVSSGASQTVLVGAIANLVAPVPVGGTPTAITPPVPPIPWTLQQGSLVVIDAGTTSQEAVILTAVSANPPAITATFNKAHKAGASVSVLGFPGNPGPQSQFNVHDPLYQLVVPYFSIIN